MPLSLHRIYSFVPTDERITALLSEAEQTSIYNFRAEGTYCSLFVNLEASKNPVIMPDTYMASLLTLLRLFGLFPDENVKTHSVSATLRLILINIPLLFVFIPITLHCYMNRKTQDAVSMTNFIYTFAIFGMMITIFVYLGWKKFELRDILCEMRVMVEERMFLFQLNCYGFELIIS